MSPLEFSSSAQVPPGGANVQPDPEGFGPGGGLCFGGPTVTLEQTFAVL